MTSGAEWLIILLVIIAVFGASWLPKAARNLGRAKVELDKTKKQIDETTKQVAESTGLNQVNKGLQQARKLKNQTPQQLIKGAAMSAATGAVKPAADTQPLDDAASDETAQQPPAAAPAASVEGDDTSATVNVDFSD